MVTDEPIEATLQFGFPVEAVYRADLSERRTEGLGLHSEGTVGLRAGRHEVVRMEAVPKR